MSVYDYQGERLSSVYDINGDRLHFAYGINGNRIYEAGDTFPVKVMQYNVGQWYIGGHDNIPAEYDAEYYALQSGIISENDADVLLFEEYTAQFSKAGRTCLSWLISNYPYYHEQTNGTTTTVTQRAVFSKYPISGYTTHTFSDGSGYYYDECTITINDVPITFVVTHLHWNNRTYRAQEAQTILTGISDKENVIICGDFNLTDFFDDTGADYTQVIQPFLTAGYTIANGGDFGFLTTYSDEPEGTWTGCLDQIVTDLDITSVYVDETKLNDEIEDKIDHLPLIAVISVPY